MRTINLLGRGTTAAYLGCELSSEGWGVPSSDVGQDCRLVAVNSRVTITGRSGYGAYAIGDATERFLGCEFDVADHAAVVRGGIVHFGDSHRAAVRELNDSRELGLTEGELTTLIPQSGTVRSRRFGVMWHGPGAARTDGGTVFRTGEAVFLNKGQAVRITVDGFGRAAGSPRSCR
ncbi:hypothetical protein ACIHEI_16745 [Kitasatospora sp. NPDC051984]|uniref:hypothetical protein n=1 Tax=Kitasatospora sp. NPDC051984 TaxID=3364059 RepID=UPI0037C6A621